MATTRNPASLLYQLRHVVPRRPLSLLEALKIAELQANRLLEIAGIDAPGVPTELITNLPYIELAVRPDTPTDVAGGTLWLKPRWLIVLSGTDSLERQRFSTFHEFKHILDHPLASTVYRFGSTADAQQRTEQVANYFAACALMPRRLVKRLWGQGHQGVSDLASQFGVSYQAMQYRLDQLGLTDRRPRCAHALANYLPFAQEIPRTYEITIAARVAV